MITFGTDGWRGIIGNDFTVDNVRAVAQATAQVFLKRSPQPIIYVGYDRRFRSRDFALEIIKVLTANGLKTSLAGHYCPTPCISWWVKSRQATGGIIVTASHNPQQWNGFKVKENYGGAASTTTTTAIEEELRKNIATEHAPQLMSLDEARRTNLFDEFQPWQGYIEQLRSLVDLKAIRRAKLKIAYDPMYGSGGGYLTRVLGPSVAEIHGEANPGFGGTNPEPIDVNLTELKKMVVQGRFDLGLATDGDADRIGAVDEKGHFVDSHHIFALILRHLVEVKKKRGAVVKTVTTTHMIDRLARRYNLPLHETAVGFKHICEKFLEFPLTLIGGEESGGIGICHHLLERDGLLCALLLLEIMATHGKPLSKIVAGLRREIGGLVYRRVDLRVPREKIESLMQRLGKNGLGKIGPYPVLKIDARDGFKFYLEGDAWLLIRPSGTEPLLRTYAEAPTLKDVEKILGAAKKLIHAA